MQADPVLFGAEGKREQSTEYDAHEHDLMLTKMKCSEREIDARQIQFRLKLRF